MPRRKEQVESALKRAVSDVLSRGLSDPRVTGMVSITRVEVSDDLRDAQVFVSIMPAKNQDKSLAGLKHAVGHIHREVGERVAMRAVPHLHFKLDQSLKKQARVLAAIDRAVPDKTATPPHADKPQDPDPAQEPRP